MGYQTNFIGSGSIYLDQRASGPRALGVDEEVINAVRATAPRGWSNWTACPQGCCLSYDGGDKASHMVPWLKFLMESFLIPGAKVPSLAGVEGLRFALPGTAESEDVPLPRVRRRASATATAVYAARRRPDADSDSSLPSGATAGPICMST